MGGEYTLSELATKLARGGIRPTDDYWTKGMSGWGKVSELMPQIEAYRKANAPQAQTSGNSKATEREYHFARDGKEYAVFTESQLRANWPTEIKTTDTFWYLGAEEWKPAWQLQNELRANKPPARAITTAPNASRTNSTNKSATGRVAIENQSHAEPSGGLIAILAITAVCLIGWIVTNRGGITSDATADVAPKGGIDENDALEWAKTEVSEWAISPGTVRFVSGTIREKGNGLYVASGELDSQNEKAVMTRKSWRVEFAKRDDSKIKYRTRKNDYNLRGLAISGEAYFQHDEPNNAMVGGKDTSR